MFGAHLQQHLSNGISNMFLEFSDATGYCGVDFVFENGPQQKMGRGQIWRKRWRLQWSLAANSSTGQVVVQPSWHKRSIIGQCPILLKMQTPALCCYYIKGKNCTIARKVFAIIDPWKKTGQRCLLMTWRTKHRRLKGFREHQL